MRARRLDELNASGRKGRDGRRGNLANECLVRLKQDIESCKGNNCKLFRGCRIVLLRNPLVYHVSVIKVLSALT